MKNINIRNILLFCVLVIANLACSSLMQIERQADFSFKKVKQKQIVSINPSFNIKTQKKGQKSKQQNKYSESVRREKKLNNLLVDNAKKNDLILQIIDTDDLQNNDASFFNYLAPLRKEILQVNYLQDFKDINANPTKSNKTEILYQNGPKISTHYSHLAEVYGTPFFAIQGVFYQSDNQTNNKTAISTKKLLPKIASDQEMLYYTVIADVSKSQIVYREYRKVGADASEANLNSIIYDSFKIIAN